MQSLLVLGSTGSVGVSTLDVVSRHNNDYKIYALTASKNVQLMYEQCQQFKPRVVVMSEPIAAKQLADKLKTAGLSDIEILSGEPSLVEVAMSEQVDTVMAAIVGAVGMLPTLSAVKAGKRVLIANKEPLVMAGKLFMETANDSGATILPIDSEHNAIFQCLPENDNKLNGVNKIILTASGGPFRGRSWESLQDITPDQACAHPNWQMGRKISVDSATMMNKGLELIEACSLFSVDAEKVEVVVHPQSIIHSMVEYLDGSFLAQMGSPDMRIPIAHALAWPNRITSGAKRLDVTEIARLDFEAPNYENMPCLRLAHAAAKQGESAPVILNAANEVAVEAFLEKKVRFTDIPTIIERTLSVAETTNISNIEQVLNIDNDARRIAYEFI